MGDMSALCCCDCDGVIERLPGENSGGLMLLADTSTSWPPPPGDADLRPESNRSSERPCEADRVVRILRVGVVCPEPDLEGAYGC